MSRGFNPLVGIQIVHSGQRSRRSASAPVSIPLSGFRSFTLRLRAVRRAQQPGFNPLVGIQIVHSLTPIRALARIAVSIPLSGFRSFTLDHRRRAVPDVPVSIPLSGFRSFTPAVAPRRGSKFQFQSPCRDSDRSLKERQDHEATTDVVSIPLSGFRSFTPRRRKPSSSMSGVSIPLSGFRSFTLAYAS